jgi:molybdate-binding protein/transcriptional regulator with XRE-family HTH domain
LMRRSARKWSQAELARRAGISRAAVSAIEGNRLSPSVASALALAAVLECSVEELFGRPVTKSFSQREWAWQPRNEPCRYWEVEVDQKRLLYPVESISLNPTPHDGRYQDGVYQDLGSAQPETTLVLVCCDPAAGLLAAEYARSSGFRMLVFSRGGDAALGLLKEGVIHVAGLHRSTKDYPESNAETISDRLGPGYRMLRMAEWEEGVALRPNDASHSVGSVARRRLCWAKREPGSAAQECLERLLEGRHSAGRQVESHSAVAEAVHAGWAEAGVCVRLSAEEAGLKFLPIRTEALDLCFSEQMQHDPRIEALIRLTRSRDYRQLLSELPGYDSRSTGELRTVETAARSNVKRH